MKPDTGKAVEVDLPHIITPGDIAITTGPTPTIFITDTQSLCVHKYSTNGTHKGTIPLQGFGVQRPAGIAYMAGYLLLGAVYCLGVHTVNWRTHDQKRWLCIVHVWV